LQVHGSQLVRINITTAIVDPEGIVVGDLTRVLEDTPHIADDKQGRHNVEEDHLKPGSTPPLLIAVLMWHIMLEHWDEVINKVIHIETDDSAAHKEHRQEFGTLPKAPGLRGG
jgi:hypothetical protein